MKSLTSTQTKPIHKQRIACLSKCITWSLSITLKTFKTTLSYQYLPKSIFVHKDLGETNMELSELDSNQSSLGKSLCSIGNQEQQKANAKTSLQRLTLPIENKPTFYQYEKRLSLIANETEDDFTFVIPIELDNNQSSPKEHVKLLKDINNSFLSREIYCNLNGTIHNHKFLSKDIHFIVEPKRLVKSIQFRIEKYKNNWIKNSLNGANKQQQLKKTFFTMLIDNQSIGFEFLKKIDNIEVLPTNFNSIVNGGVALTRFFIFIPMPKALLFLKTPTIYKDPQQIGTPTTQANSINSMSTQGKSNKLSLENFFSPKSLGVNFGYSVISPEIVNIKRNKFNAFDFNDYTEIVMTNSKLTPSRELAPLNEVNYQNDYHYYKMTELDDEDSYENSTQKKTKLASTRKLNEVVATKIDSIMKECTHTCNYLLFSKQCSLSIHSASKSDYYSMKLISFFNVFTPISLFGLDVNYVLTDNESTIEGMQKVTYFPTLSSMALCITDPDLIERILKEISNKKIRQSLSDKTPSVKSLTEDLDNENKTNCSEAYTEYIIIEGLKVIVGQDSLRIEFIESKPPFIRNLLAHQIWKCLSSLKAFELIDIEKIVINSWFCVSWNPHSINKDQRLQKTIFLSYYQFKPSSDDFKSNETNEVYRSIPPIGILPIKYDERQWVSSISNENDASDYDHLVTRAMTNVEEYVYLNANQTSIDYDFYLKSMMAKQHNFTSQSQLFNSLTDCS